MPTKTTKILKNNWNQETPVYAKQTPMVKVYKMVVNPKTGAQELKPDGEKNIDVEISQHVGVTDYKKQIVVDPIDGRFKHIGGEERKSVMMDTTAVPKTPAELKELEIKTISKVERLNLARENLAKKMDLLQEQDKAARSTKKQRSRKKISKSWR